MLIGSNGFTAVAVLMFTGSEFLPNECLLDFGDSATAHTLQIKRRGSDPVLAFSIKNGNNDCYITISESIVQDMWHTMLAQYNASTLVLSLRMGDKYESTTCSSSRVDRTFSKTYVGKGWGGDYGALTGKIAGLYVVDTFLTAQEVSDTINGIYLGNDLFDTWCYQACQSGYSIDMGTMTCAQCPTGWPGSGSVTSNHYCTLKICDESEEYFDNSQTPPACAKCSTPDDPNWSCRGCECSKYRDALTASTRDPCDMSSRMYLDGVTRLCEYCPVNKLISTDPKERGCYVGRSIPHAEFNENIGHWECGPGYYVDNKVGCVKCSTGTYKKTPDTRGAVACTLCPGNTTTRSNGSISVQDCAFCGFDERLAQSKQDGSFSCQPCEPCTLMREAVHMHKTCSVCGFGDYSFKGDTDSLYGTMCILSQCLGVVRTDDHELDEHLSMIAIPSMNDILYGFMNSLSRPNDDIYDMDKIFGAEPLFYLVVNGLPKPKPNAALPAVLLHASLQNFGFWLLLEQMQQCASNDETCFKTKKQAYQQKMWDLIPVYNALQIELVASQLPIAMPAPEQGDTAAHEAKCRGGHDTTIRLEAENTNDAFELVTSIFFLDEPLERASCAQQGNAEPACTSMFVYGREQV